MKPFRRTFNFTALGAGLMFCLGGISVQALHAITLPPGTQIQVRVNEKLDTGASLAGETITGTVTEPVVVNGRTVINAGTPVKGQISQAISSGRLKKPASITLEIMQANRSAMSTAVVRVDGKSHLVRNAEYIGGGAAAGAVIGALVGGKKGAVIGGATGAGAGTAGAFLTGKKEIVIPAETILPFEVPGGSQSPASITANRRQQETQPSNGRVTYPSPSPASSNQPATRRDYHDEISRQPIFSETDKRLVRRYYSDNYSNLPPGLAKRGGNLPPGLERQVERNGTLPPGLQKRVEPFPSDLDSRMGRLPPGCSRVFMGNKAMILDRNNRILDVMQISGGGDEGNDDGHGRGRGHGHGRGRDRD